MSDCICDQGFGMNLSCPTHGVGRAAPAAAPGAAAPAGAPGKLPLSTVSSEDAEYLCADAEAALEVFDRTIANGFPRSWAMEDAIRAVDKIRAFVLAGAPGRAAPTAADPINSGGQTWEQYAGALGVAATPSSSQAIRELLNLSIGQFATGLVSWDVVDGHIQDLVRATLSVSGPEQGAAGGPTTEQVAAALGSVWNEICADNGCFPDCINVEQEPELTLYADFRRGEFARLVAETLRAALRSAPPGSRP